MKTAGQIALLFLLLLVYLSAAPALFAQPDFSALDINPKWNGASYDPGVLRFCDAASWPASTDCVGVSAAANSAAYTVRVPTTVGAAGEALVTDGNDSAQLSWAANSPGGCPAGAEDSIQLNRSSACAADDLTWSGSGLSLNPAGVEATLLQMGSVSSAQLGILDFRTSGFPGFDTRLSASGGETTDGLGTLTLIADSFTFAGNVDLKFLSSGVNDFGTSFTPAGKMFATFVQSGGLDREKAANVFFNARTSGFPGFDVRWSFGGGSTTDGLGDITLSAENFFFSTDVDFRFLVGDSNNWGTSFTPAGDGWWTNLDTTQTLMVDGNATFGGDIRFASDGTSDVGTTSVRAGDGYSDTWNSEVVRITNTGHTSHYALTWDSVYFNVARTDGVVSFRLTNADHKALFKGAVAAEADLHLLTDDGLDQWIWTTNVSDHLELKEVGGAGVVLTFDAFANKLNIGSSYLLVTQAISVAAKDIDCQGAAGCNLGGPWGDIDMRGFLEIESPNAQLGFKAESALGGGDANTGAWQVYNSAGLVRMHSWVNGDGDNSGLYLYNDASNLTAGLTTGTLGGADSAYFFLKDGWGRQRVLLFEGWQ